MSKITLSNNFFKCVLMIFVSIFISVTTACGLSLKVKSDIHAEIQKYEWSDLYDHKESYEESCENLFLLLPSRLKSGKFSDSLILKNDKDFFISVLNDSLIPAYGGKYMNGIPMKNRNSYEECYETTIEVLRTLHKECIEMGIIQKKAE